MDNQVIHVYVSLRKIRGDRQREPVPKKCSPLCKIHWWLSFVIHHASVELDCLVNLYALCVSSHCLVQPASAPIGISHQLTNLIPDNVGSGAYA